MILLLRKWNGNFPSVIESKSNVWFSDSSEKLTTWILSHSHLSWGCRSSAGWLGEGELNSNGQTYQWRAWTSREFLRNAYETKKILFNAERKALDEVTKELNLDMIEKVVAVSLEKDQAGITASDLDALLDGGDK